MTGATDAIVEQLRNIEESLRELAFDRLRDATEGDVEAAAEERRLQQARRAVERAIYALGREPDSAWS